MTNTEYISLPVNLKLSLSNEATQAEPRRTNLWSYLAAKPPNDANIYRKSELGSLESIYDYK